MRILSPVATEIVTCVSVTTTVSSTVTVTVLLPFTKTFSYAALYDTSSIALAGVGVSTFGTSPTVIGGVSYYPCTFNIPSSLIVTSTLTVTGTLLIKESVTVSFSSTIKVCT